ncbi:MAG: putative 5-methyltetrahydropteroyltriglutamate--homocysteine S-methyltransferase [Streblomastix strix]|uniref:Putative 5-methyltetrahydropteroyltriglutamate--homocysteine S-methyltransferase n=1 Tax=Streblomastix strix TaxID=222440 RepID=A0A5J4WJD4_9EUKA|nr:MAG: putative 5-methyltetrahydropteroyltriglutamate--homocysteine S-methyltransferase [Streblomastix strix]
MSTIPFRYDIVGSFLRPAVLTQARDDFREGKIDLAKLKEFEHEEIKKLVAKEAEVGLKAVTDGEFPRAWWHLDFLVGLKGMQKIETPKGYGFHSSTTRMEHFAVVGRVQYNPDHPFFANYEFLKSVTPAGVLAKVSIPTPAMIFNYRSDEITPDFYKGNKEQFLNDLIDAYKQSMNRFYELGCRYFQIDDTRLTGFIWSIKNAKNEQEKQVQLSMANDDLFILNKIFEGKPNDLFITIHSCRGNFKSDYIFDGSYSLLIGIISKLNVDGLFLEYDNERSGGFEPLAQLYAENKNRKIVIGLITSKFGKLETEEEIIARIHEAEKFIPLNSLCLSTQCGFASTEEGNKITEDEQLEKMKLVVKIAKQVWSDA